jgi:hypothetical protein
MSGTHTFTTESKGWNVSTLWEKSKSLMVRRVLVEDLLRTLDPEVKRILEADLHHPIILSAQGHIMDGAHRLAKAVIQKHHSILAVQFEVDPEPDFIPIGKE